MSSSKRHFHPAIGIVTMIGCCLFSLFAPAQGLPPVLIKTLESDAQMKIDGVLDEPVWQNIPEFSDFRVISPDTLEPAATPTRIKLFYTDKGLYFAADMIQDPRHLVERLSGRDQYVNRDRISISIDASGEGLYAYWFAVNLGGSLMDGTILPERDYSSNWDGPWRGASHRTETGWSVEMLLPWSMMALPPSSTGQRQIGVYIQRAVASIDEDWAYPALPRTQNQFLSQFPKTTISDIDPKQQITFYPYVSSNWDQAADQTQQKAGFDLFWRPTTAFQVTGSFNPDFGNVESDNVVVNLTSYETFFPEKRPFFLEGQEIFTTSPRANPGWGPGGGGSTPTTLLNTRRIGAPPRALNDTSILLSQTEENRPSELLGAAKVTGQSGAFRYGMLLAAEDDTTLTGVQNAEAVKATQAGRDFVAARLLWENASGAGRTGAGLMVTEVAHPDATARTLGVDLHYLSANGKLIVDFQSLSSDTEADQGHGGFADIVYRPERGKQHKLTIDYFDRTLDVNDFGFLQRNDLKGYRYTYQRNQSNLKRLRSLQTRLAVTQRWNFEGEQTRVGFFSSREMQFPNNTQLSVDLNFFPERWEDRDSSGNGSFRLENRFQTGFNFRSDGARAFSYRLGARLQQEDIGGQKRSYSLDFEYQPTARFSAKLDLNYESSDGWLLHDTGTDFTRFNSERLRPKFELSYFFSAAQQLRISLQWIGIKAFERDRWQLLNQRGDLTLDSREPSENAPGRDFSISRLSFQARYRWELAPLSDLFLVYTRGSDLPSHVQTSFSDLFQDALDQALVDSLVFKLRYRFGQ